MNLIYEDVVIQDCRCTTTQFQFFLFTYDKMNSQHILLFTILVILVYVLYTRKESFDLQSTVPIQQQIKCAQFQGQIVDYHGKPACKLPDQIKDITTLNFQLAGRVCDLERMVDANVCYHPKVNGISVETNPYSVTVSNGNYRWYP
jgi:hypothetical protein